MRASFVKVFASLTAAICIVVLAAAAPARPGLLPAHPHPNGLSTRSADTTAQSRQESFDLVWRTVKEKHFDPTLGGVDWENVRLRYAPRITAAGSDAEFYDLLQQMLGELHQSHFAIIPPGTFVEDESKEPSPGGIGIDLRIVDGQALITRIDPNSAAALAGLALGFKIDAIDDTQVIKVLERFASAKGTPGMKQTRIVRYLVGRLNGAPGTSVRIVAEGARGESLALDIRRERLPGEISPGLGNFPSLYTEFESKLLEGGIGYIRFNLFVMPLMEKIRTAIRSMKDAHGIVFDLRGNPGGLGGMSAGIAGLLESKQATLGTMTMRSGHLNFIAYPQKDAFLGPVVILIDGMSASTSEVLAGGMQELGRATIVGEPSAGAALPSVFQKLPTGALFQYAIADFKTPKGTMIEGRGVIPDIEVRVSQRALLRGGDPQLARALEIIQKQMTFDWKGPTQ
jgi:carboxyl-terminal processing protease